MNVDRVAAHFRASWTGGPVPPVPPCDGIGARVLFGTDEGSFSHLSAASQPYPFIIGPESISALCAIPVPMKAMGFIGFDEAWVGNKLRQGNRFRMVLFAAESCDGGFIRATWANLLALTERESPRCADKLRLHRNALETLPYPDLRDKIGYDLEKPPRGKLARVDSFQAFADDSCPGDFGHARAFLRQVFKCTALFRGDGYAYDEEGRRGAAEYLVKRRAIADLAGVQWVPVLP